MKKTLLILLINLILVGCGVSSDYVRTQNKNNLNKISLNMSKSKVLDIMGTENFKQSDGTNITNPFRSETFNENNKTYEVLFYYTDFKKSDGVITDDELTPIVFFDGKVVGYGWLYLKDTIKRYQIDIR